MNGNVGNSAPARKVLFCSAAAAVPVTHSRCWLDITLLSPSLPANAWMVLQVGVLIVGAGPTGLGAATRLQQHGHTDWLLIDQVSAGARVCVVFSSDWLLCCQEHRLPTGQQCVGKDAHAVVATLVASVGTSTANSPNTRPPRVPYVCAGTCMRRQLSRAACPAPLPPQRAFCLTWGAMSSSATGSILTNCCRQQWAVGTSAGTRCSGCRTCGYATDGWHTPFKTTSQH